MVQSKKEMPLGTYWSPLGSHPTNKKDPIPNWVRTFEFIGSMMIIAIITFGGDSKSSKPYLVGLALSLAVMNSIAGFLYYRKIGKNSYLYLLVAVAAVSYGFYLVFKP